MGTDYGHHDHAADLEGVRNLRTAGGITVGPHGILRERSPPLLRQAAREVLQRPGDPLRGDFDEGHAQRREAIGQARHHACSSHVLNMRGESYRLREKK